MILKRICRKTLTISALCFLTASFAQEAEQKTQQEAAGKQAPQTEQKIAETQELPPITVTGVRTNARVDTLGQTVAIIEREQFEKSELPFLTDLLQEQPGISFYSYGPRASSPVISIRGMHSAKTRRSQHEENGSPEPISTAKKI